jgi:hypothetical protein
MYKTFEELSLKENYSSFLYTAVIVEPRNHKALHLVIQNACENLSLDWCILIYHGTKNKALVNDIIQSLPDDKHRITTIEMSLENLSIEKYNRLLISEWFYDAILTEMFLIFQTDSIILKEHKHKINHFMSYDYVGAPWKNCPMKIDITQLIKLKNPISSTCVGNGGFSLRRKSKMLDIIHTIPYENQPEDVYFSSYTQNKPLPEEAKHFSVENIFYEEPFAVHKIWTTLSSDDMKYLRERYKEISLLEKANN